MSFLENLALVGTAATILGVFLTRYAIVNNKTLKQESKLTRETLTKAITAESRLTREIIVRETYLVREMIKEIAEYLGNLIVAEGDRTHQTV